MIASVMAALDRLLFFVLVFSRLYIAMISSTPPCSQRIRCRELLGSCGQGSEVFLMFFLKTERDFNTSIRRHCCRSFFSGGNGGLLVCGRP